MSAARRTPAAPGSSLRDPAVGAVLDRLHADADQDDARRQARPADPRLSGELSAAERTKALEHLYLPISREAGRLCYLLVRAARPETVVEFGTSFGISTVYLAAGLRDNGRGRVITTELSETKAAAALHAFRSAGLDDRVELRIGDALDTLRDLDEPVQLLLLDGWKDLCLPVLRLLEPRLPPGSIVLADDVAGAPMADYLAYVRDPGNGYETVEFPVADGVEISCRTG